MERHRLDNDRAGSVARSAPSRNKRSDRVEFLPNVDGRTLLARRWQQFASDLVSDQGGVDAMSTARLFLCKRLAAVSAMIEEIEGNYVAGKKIDTDAYLALTNTAVRLSNTLGLNRRTKSVPDLNQYINSKRPRVIEHDDAEDDDD